MPAFVPDQGEICPHYALLSKAEFGCLLNRFAPSVFFVGVTNDSIDVHTQCDIRDGRGRNQFHYAVGYPVTGIEVFFP